MCVGTDLISIFVSAVFLKLSFLKSDFGRKKMIVIALESYNMRYYQNNNSSNMYCR